MNNAIRDNLIYKHYQKYHSKRALGFCCSRVHAEYMAGVFTKKGIPSVAVYSLQQLGRGLRTSKGKEWLNVLDFIGNYKFAGKNLSLLSEQKRTGSLGHITDEVHYPDGCLVDFDMELIDLFEELNKRKLSIHETIQNEFLRIKDLLEKVPSRMELFTHMEAEVYSLCLANARENPFKDYLSFLAKQNLLTGEEKKLHSSIAKDFLFELEKTSMTKSYKMPVLYSFIDGKTIRKEASEELLLNTWKDFFSKNKNWKDLPKITSYQAYLNITDKAHLDNIKKNPVNFLKQSASDFFVTAETAPIALCEQLDSFLNNEVFASHFKDIIDYRTIDYYSRRYRDANLPQVEYKTAEPPLLKVADSQKKQ